jgi:hypothetical protein
MDWEIEAEWIAQSKFIVLGLKLIKQRLSRNKKNRRFIQLVSPIYLFTSLLIANVAPIWTFLEVLIFCFAFNLTMIMTDIRSIYYRFTERIWNYPQG